MDKLDVLELFLKERPAVSIKNFAQDIGLSYNTLYKIMYKTRPITEKSWEKIKIGFLKYGFDYKKHKSPNE